MDKDRDLLKPNMCWDEMVGQHCRPNRHEFEQAQGDGEGQESLACCSPRKESDATEQLNNCVLGPSLMVKII